MQKTLSAYPGRLPAVEQVLIVPREIYNALHPYDQLIAQALEKIGKVRIVDGDR
jgi:hypothetical protein